MALVYACGVMGWKANLSFGSYCIKLAWITLHYTRNALSHFLFFSQNKVKWTVTGKSYLKFRVDVNGEKNKFTVENKQEHTGSSHSEHLNVWTGHFNYGPYLLPCVVGCPLLSVTWHQRCPETGNCYRNRYVVFRQ